MIVSFSLENWTSFRNQVTFSMVASRERQHGDRVPKLGKYQTRVLPVAAIYGGNASGKTNFFKALSFAKALVVKGTQPDSLIPVEPFRLDAKVADQPSRFGFELLIDEIIYEFSFAVTRKAVLEEKLVAITSTSEKVLYHRREGKPNFDDSLAKDQFLQFAFKGTRDNQLFLTNSVSQKVDNFRPVYDWFKDTLELVAKKLVTYHPKADGTEAKFEIRQESDGSQRVIDLLPAFLELSAQVSKKVYVIDEVDRSLHTLLTRRLLEAYLANCSTETRTQLLLTTHDVLLMDQQLLRRDEMWVAERDATGASNLLSFSEYKDVRYDKDIRKSYMQGRLGGIPRILLGGALTNPCLTEESEGDD